MRRLVLAALILALCSCTPEAPPPPPKPVVTVAAYNPTDVAWAQLMAAMNERVLKVLDLAPGRTADPALADLAGSVGRGHRDELARLRAILTSAKAGPNPHEGHDMPGMPTPIVIEAAARAKGKAFDKILLKSLKGHLDQSAMVTASEQKAGAAEEALDLAADMTAARTEQLAALSGIAR
ncbi:DUF305 domain-containing protein [Herbidospora sp. NEAU-GS84]|uniref:DUF305 domain-containing protein n=1 Tax=Herbidospora solisilvae TaxID=2696284 RepID=A0A7C9NFI5_9ACTN|nr:DUF305 domain-containing protein [Herbidospora solisilvae]NAS21072.1 DUF305 domain-containing protein [Herbidospora solisilvae]